MRSHPLTGGFFVALGIMLLPAGVLLPVGMFSWLSWAPEVVVPFVAWQLATWSLLLGVFFLRPRAAHNGPLARD